MNKQSDKLKQMTYTALMAVFIAICSQICVPAVVPFTLQTMAIFCTLDLLGGFHGTVSVLLYIGMGIVGLPVFHGVQGSISVIAGTSGGFIIGFAVSSAIYALLDGKIHKNILWILWILIDYVCGTLWYYAFYVPENGIVGSIIVCVVPFIIPDILKLLIALEISKRLKRLIK